MHACPPVLGDGNQGRLDFGSLSYHKAHGMKLVSAVPAISAALKVIFQFSLDPQEQVFPQHLNCPGFPAAF